MESTPEIAVVAPPVQALQEAAPVFAPYAPTPAELRRKTRIWCATILAITLPIIAIALYLKPDSRGTGSHTQLGLPPCGWYVVTGQPCPMCGCTTAATHIIHGQILSGFVTQPFGAVFAIATVMAALLGLLGVATGRWYGPEPFWIAWHWRGILFGSLALLLLGWGYKIMFVNSAHGW